VKLSFLPADLHLRKEENEYFTVTLGSEEILRCRSGKKAMGVFNSLKNDLEKKFPTHNLSPEEKAEILRRTIADE
jgi:hypothetical protein